MIFVTVGTHPDQFNRLIKKIDSLAPLINEEIVIQRGFTRYVPKHCTSFTFTDKMDDYYKKARMVIVQSGTSLLEFSLQYKKPVLTVPRQAKYKEHINDHQVEFGEYFSKKTGIACVLDVNELTAEFLKNYSRLPTLDMKNLSKFRDYFKKLFDKIEEDTLPQKPYATNRTDYAINLIEPSKSDRLLNIGVSNIPEVEMKLENLVKECVTLDFDGAKLDKAKKFVKKTIFIKDDLTKPKILKGKFDKVIMLEVLEHIKDDLGTVRTINGLMNKGGLLVLSVPNNAFIHIINPVKYAEHERHYSIKHLTELLQSNGFKVEHVNTVERWTLLLNVYAHLFFKYIMRKQIRFGLLFNGISNRSYRQKNEKGLDIFIKAKKISECS